MAQETKNSIPNNVQMQDITLIGAGIMTATLAMFVKELLPEAKVTIYEKLEDVAAESTNSWNNAGTGHSAFCELNYTPEETNGGINIEKAVKIASDFEVSRQFWTYLKKQGILKEKFINTVPHMSFVWGDDNISFLKKRHKALIQYALFEGMEYSEDFEEIASWAPIMMQNRNSKEKIGVTRMKAGTDVNFDVIAKGIFKYLENTENVTLSVKHKVKDFVKQKDGSWEVVVKDLNTGKTKKILSKHVFIGAGGGALPILQKSGIKESKGYGGFPVSGMFLQCNNPKVIKQHKVKVYGKAAEGSPPMSMPHLDKRFIDGQESLLFGPYAGFSTKFLKTGSYFDLPKSVKTKNIKPMLAVARHNFSLIKYLVNQAMLSPKKRFKTLKLYFPEARMEDWDLYVAGQRVQIMKKDKEKGGVLKLGTEIISNSEGTLAALLGASPGASTSVSIMLDLLSVFYPEKMKSDDFKNKLKEMIPSYGESLADNAELCKKMREFTNKELDL